MGAAECFSIKFPKLHLFIDLIVSSWNRQELFHQLQGRLTIKRARLVNAIAVTSCWALSIVYRFLNCCSVEHVFNNWVSMSKKKWILAPKKSPWEINNLLRQCWDHCFNLIGSANILMIIRRANKVTNAFLHARIRVDVVLSEEVIKAIHHVTYASLVIAYVCVWLLIKSINFVLAILTSIIVVAMTWDNADDFWEDEESANANNCS